jgi:hypothetical protein
MRCWSFSGSFTSDFFAGLVTSSVHFVVKLGKRDVISAFVGGAASGDRGSFGFRGRVCRVAAFIGLSGVYGDSALAYGELDQIAWFDTRLSSDRFGDAKPFLFDRYSHKNSKRTDGSDGSIANGGFVRPSSFLLGSSKSLCSWVNHFATRSPHVKQASVNSGLAIEIRSMAASRSHRRLGATIYRAALAFTDRGPEAMCYITE